MKGFVKRRVWSSKQFRQGKGYVKGVGQEKGWVNIRVWSREGLGQEKGLVKKRPW